jgi:hypothetical protein
MYKSVYAKDTKEVMQLVLHICCTFFKMAMHQLMFVELNQYGECHNNKISLYFECSDLIIGNIKQIQKSVFLSTFEKGHSGSLKEGLLVVTEIKENKI